MEILEKIQTEINNDFYKQNFANVGERFVAWYIKNIYLKSDIETRFAITDGQNDKGIDAVLIDEDKKEIIIIQGKFYKSNVDSEPLKEILSSWMQIQNLEVLQANSNEKVRNKIEDIYNCLKDDDYEIVFELLTTGDLTENAKNDLMAFQNSIIEFEHPEASIALVDLPVIQTRLEEALNQEVPKINYTLPIYDGRYIEMNIANYKTVIAAIKLSDAIKIPGIKDRRLFRKNVRQALPKSNKVNRKIKQTVEGETPEYFFLYHNGITAICDELNLEKSELKLRGLNVVNGCQSLTTLYSSSLKVKDKEAYILFKFYEIPQKDIANNISINTNAQSAVKPRDLKSNDKRVIALKRTYEETYKDGYFIRQRGEERPADKDSNKTVDLVIFSKCVMSWYCQRPNIAYNENKIFDKHFDLIFKEAYSPKDVLTLVSWFKVIEQMWNNNAINLNENLLSVPSYSKHHLLFSIQYCFSAANNQFDKVPFPQYTSDLLDSPNTIIDLAINSFNSAFEMIVEERNSTGKIVNMQNWLKSNDSVLKIQTAIGLTIKVMQNIPGGKELKESMKISPDKFFLRLKAD